MNKRLQQIIELKTGGKQREFADLMGWAPQYLGKLIKGVNFGLQPVLALLQKFPEIDARWLLLGEGKMISDKRISEARAAIRESMIRTIEIEKYIPVMTPNELDELQHKSVAGEFDQEKIQEWEMLLNEQRQKNK